MNSKELFLKTSPMRLFFIVALPGAVSMLASALYSIFDGIFVGQILGDTAFAAINFAIPFVIFNFALSDLVGVGSAVPISIALGEKRDREANNIFTCSSILIVLTGIFMGVLLYFGAPPVMTLMGAEGEMAKYATDYIRVYALCSPITTAVFAYDNYLRICGKVRFSMFLNIFLSLGTAALEFVFLFVCQLEIWSAAFASCICMITVAIIGLIPFLRGKLQLKFCRPHFSFPMIRKIVSCGSPIFFSNIAGRVFSLVMNAVLIRLGNASALGGENAVSVYGITNYVGEIIRPVVYGLCDSTQPAIGYNWGARRYDRAKALSRCAYVATAVVSAVASATLVLFPAFWVGLFSKNTDPVFLAAAVKAVQLLALARVLQWFSFTTQSFMTGVEKPLYATVISLAATFLIPLPLIFILYPLGLDGMWLNMPATALFECVIAGWLLLRFRRDLKKNPLPSPEEDPPSLPDQKQR